MSSSTSLASWQEATLKKFGAPAGPYEKKCPCERTWLALWVKFKETEVRAQDAEREIEELKLAIMRLKDLMKDVECDYSSRRGVGGSFGGAEVGSTEGGDSDEGSAAVDGKGPEGEEYSDSKEEIEMAARFEKARCGTDDADIVAPVLVLRRDGCDIVMFDVDAVEGLIKTEDLKYFSRLFRLDGAPALANLSGDFLNTFFSLGLAPVNVHIRRSQIAAFRMAVEGKTQCGEADIVIGPEEGKVFAWRGYKSISSTVLISCLLEAGIDMVHVSAVGQKETCPEEVLLVQMNSLLRLDLALTIRLAEPAVVTLCGKQLGITGDARTYALFLSQAAAARGGHGRTYDRGAQNRSLGLSGTAALGVNFMVKWVLRVLQLMDKEQHSLAEKARELFGKKGLVLVYQLSIYHHVARVYSRLKCMTRAKPNTRDALTNAWKASLAVGGTLLDLCETW